MIDRGQMSHVRDACSMLMTLSHNAKDTNCNRQVYEEDFELPFLQQSREFYKVKHKY